MECWEACTEAGKDVRMLTLELEAAKALARLACSSSLRGEFERRRCQQIVTETLVVSSQPSQALGGQQLSRKTSTMVAGPTNTLKTVDIASNQTCNTSNQSKVSGTLRHNLTEAEKEARKLRRVLANRESALQTIRRREAMHLELTGKAANLSIENTYLKQERELALKKYNYLKNKKEFLKAQMVKRKHAETGHTHDRPESSRTEISSSAAATTPICSHNQPCLVPFFWPFNSQCASNPDFTNGSQFRVPIWDESCLNQGQEYSTAITKTRPPFFILPGPWLLPFVSPSSKLEFHRRTKDQQHEPPPIHQCPMPSFLPTQSHEDNHNSGEGVYNSARVIAASNGHGAGYHFPPDYTKQGFSDKNHGGRFISSSKKSGNDAVAASEARRKRRELMKLKKVHSPDAPLK